VENIGIISLGLGLGLLGRSQGNPVVAFLGFSGGLLHVLNHGLFKGLLFQGAGSVLHGAGTREIDRLGGLSRKMPHTAATFLVGAAAICGLPPLNGFVSEWLIYVGAFRGAATLSSGGSVAALFAIVSLALIGGLAAACFVKAYGVVFLGEPRSEAASHAHESPRPMLWAMWMGAALCALVGLAPVQVVRLIAPAAASLAQIDAAPLEAMGPLAGIVRASAVLVGLLLALALLRRLLLRRAEVAAGATWGCGYAQPSPRMQYTAASFADPVLAPFGVVFHRSAHAEGPSGAFPRAAAWEEHLEDRAERVLVPAVKGFAQALKKLDFLQRGRTQLYLAYVLATLVALLVWQAVKGAP
jgi:hydrogenase-4 component B